MATNTAHMQLSEPQHFNRSQSNERQQTQKQSSDFFKHYLVLKLSHTQDTPDFISETQTSLVDLQPSEPVLLTLPQQQNSPQKTTLTNPNKAKRRPKQRQQD